MKTLQKPINTEINLSGKYAGHAFSSPEGLFTRLFDPDNAGTLKMYRLESSGDMNQQGIYPLLWFK